MGSRLLSRLAVATAAAGVLTLSTATASWADEAPEPTLKTGNVTTCEGAGLDGEILIQGNAGSATGPAGSGTVVGLKLNVKINDGFTATGIVVKGGPDAYVYEGPFEGPTEVEGMIAPPNGGDNTPAISHWFVCGEKPDNGTTSPSNGTTPPGNGTTPPGNGTTPAGNGGTSPGAGGGLPVTGTSANGILFGGIALLVGGVALMAVRRRRAVSELTEES